jgi:hypothetical protein
MAEKASGNVATGATVKGKPAGITKMDAVRKAMTKLGWEAGRAPIREYVKSHFGVDMTADHVSTCRGDILRQRAAKAKSAGAKSAALTSAVTSAAGKGSVAKASTSEPTPAATQTKPSPATPRVSEGVGNGSAKAESGISLTDILAVKDLVGRVGVSHLKSLIDAFAH